MPLDITGKILGTDLANELTPTITPYNNSDGYLSPTQLAAVNANSALATQPTLIYWEDFSQVLCTYLVDNLNVVDNVAVSGIPKAGQVLTATSATTANWQTSGGGGGGNFTAGGDLAGSGTFQEVVGILGSPLPVLADGYLFYNGTKWLLTPISGGGGSGITALTGDVTASGSGSVSAEVIGLLNNSLPSLPVSDGYLHYNGSAWQFSAITIPSSLPPTGAAGGDLSGTYPNPTVTSLTGSGGIINVAATGNVINWNKTTSAPGLAQAILTTDSVPNNMTIVAQSAELAAATNLKGADLILQAGSGATSNGKSGNVITTIQAPIGSATESYFQVNRGSTTIANIGQLPSVSEAGLWLNAAGTTPTAANCVIDSFSTGVYFNDSGHGVVALSISDIPFFTLNNTGLINTATVGSTFNLGIQSMSVASYGGTVGCIGLPVATTATSGAVTGSVLYTESDGYFCVVPNGASAPTFKVSSTDVQITTNGTNLDLFAPASAAGGVGVISIGKALTNPSASVANTAQIFLGSGGSALQFNPPNAIAGVAPLQVSSVGTFSSAGYNLYVNTSSATGSNIVGGIILAKATTNPTTSIVNSTIYADSSTGAISFCPPTTTAAVADFSKTNLDLNGINVLWSSNSGDSSIGFTDLATNSGTGAKLQITAQNETGTTSTGGNLILSSGSGTTANGLVNIQAAGTTLFQYGAAGVAITSATQAMVNGVNTLTAAKYVNGLIILTGTITAAATLVFPNVVGFWYVDVSALSGVSGTNTLGFTSGSKTVTAVTTLAATDELWIVSTRGSNTITINT